MPPKIPEKLEALLEAIRADDVAAVSAALLAGADVNGRSWNNRTPLHYAVSCADSAIVQMLIDNNADPNLEDDSGFTPLHLAVTAKNLAQAEILLNGGADINFQIGNGVAPIHSAFFQDMCEAETARMEFMLTRGADLSVTMPRNGREMTVVELAQDAALNASHGGVLLSVVETWIEMREQIQGILGQHELKQIAETAEKDIGKIRQSARASKNRFRL